MCLTNERPHRKPRSICLTARTPARSSPRKSPDLPPEKTDRPQAVPTTQTKNIGSEMATKTINRSEEAEQARLVKWTHLRQVREAMPELAWLYHAANGGLRSGFTGAQMKALGVQRGVPDLTLPVARPTFNGLIIEMKSETGSLSSEQKAWRDHYLSQNWEFYVCRSAAEGRLALCDYLGVLPDSVPELP